MAFQDVESKEHGPSPKEVTHIIPPEAEGMLWKEGGGKYVIARRQVKG